MYILTDQKKNFAIYVIEYICQFLQDIKMWKDTSVVSEKLNWSVLKNVHEVI